MNTTLFIFTTTYEEKPEIFKLFKKEGMWKVTEIGMGERGHFKEDVIIIYPTRQITNMPIKLFY